MQPDQALEIIFQSQYYNCLPFILFRNWGSEREGDLPKVTQLLGKQDRAEASAHLHPETVLLWKPRFLLRSPLLMFLLAE